MEFKQNDLLGVLLALEERIMNKLKVSTFGVVQHLDTTKKKCYVQPFPNDYNTNAQIECVYNDTLEIDLTEGSVVIVMFMDKDFRKELELILNGSTITQLPQSKMLHTELNGVIVQIYKKKE